MLKRIICAVTAAAAVFSATAVYNICDMYNTNSAAYAAEAQADTENTDAELPSVNEVLKDYDAIFSHDFENLPSDANPSDFFDEVVGTLNGVWRQNTDGTYMSSTTTGSLWANKYFDNPLSDGQYLLSFDLSKSAKEGLFYTRFFLSESSERTQENLAQSFMCNDSQIGYYTSTGGWGTSGIDYNAGEWNRVNMWIDTKAGNITYVVNNRVVGTSAMNTKLYGIAFIIQSNSGATLNDIDNLCLYKVTPDIAKAVGESGIYAPQELMYTVETEISSVYYGNIFTSFDDVKINVKNTNKIAEPIEYTATYYAENYRGDEVWRSEPKKVTLGGNETYTDEIHPVVDKYDVYTFRLEYIPTDEKYSPMYNDAEFSIANIPTPGYKNYNLGLCIHISKGVTKWDKIKRIVDISGIGLLRDDCGWGNFEKEKGVYSLDDTRDTFYTEATDMGIRLCINCEPYNQLYGMDWNTNRTATTQEQYDAIEKAYEWFASYTKGRIYCYEAGNELNFERVSDDFDAFFGKHAGAQNAVYNGVKKGNPDALVATNGLSRTPKDWVDRFIDAGAKFDVLSVHPYHGQLTPESTVWEGEIQPMNEVLSEHGLDDVQIWTTEGNTSGHYSYSAPKQHGSNAVRTFAMVDAYNINDVFFMYQIQTNEAKDDDNEAWFGILHGQNIKNAYGARPEYLQITNYIAQTENAEFVDDVTEVDDKNDGTYCLRFKKPDGSYVLMMYSNVDGKMDKISLDLGASDATLSDAYGNEEKVSSVDGKYTFVVSDDPIYLSYSGDKFERCDDAAQLTSTWQEAYEGDSRTYEFAAADDAEITVELPSNLSYNIEKADGKAKLTVTVDKNPVPYDDITLPDYQKTENIFGVEYTGIYQGYGTAAYRDFVRVTVKDESGTKFYPFGIEYLKHSADIEATIIPYSDTNTKYWKLKINVKNTLSDQGIKGTIKATAPDELVAKGKEIKVDVAADDSGIYYMNIPSSVTKWGYHQYSGVLTLENGEEISFAVGTPPRSYGYKSNAGINLKPLKHTKGETKIDGVIDESEWKDYQILSFDKSQVSYNTGGTVIDGVIEQGTGFGAEADYGGKADFSGTIYAKWDENYLYTAAVVYDDVHWQKQDYIRFHYDDNFYIDIVPSQTQRHDTRLQLALSDINGGDTPILYRNWTPVKGKTGFGVIDLTDDGAALSIIRKDTVTIYEARIPWEEIAEEKTIADKNLNIRFGIRDYDGDRDKSYSDGGWWSLVK